MDVKNSSSSTLESKYALYLITTNRHASPDTSKENIDLKNGGILEIESNFRLSLLEGNLEAAQETVVRCHLSKIVSSREDIHFESDGKCTKLQFSDNSDESFDCYYHKLVKCDEEAPSDPKKSHEPTRINMFFICLIGPVNGVLESFCPDLSKFCLRLALLLDPEGIKNKDNVQIQLKSWYPHCIGYIGRCIQRFPDGILVLLECSLWDNVQIQSENKSLLWDVERFIETCSLLPWTLKDLQETSQTVVSESSITLSVTDTKVEASKSLESSPYCVKWCERLKACNLNDHLALRNILENFRLKMVQDLNTLKRLLQRAETDHYSLFKAYQFLHASGCEDILLHHVEREACMGKQMEVFEIISCLRNFMKNKRPWRQS